ncbi:hypothetical protein [Kribbella italica]|uniref:Uncharacterized protein n=1 Tax=Kribbella italica TaxID=1540520 RepID=A0A7W9J2T8_9ACTN|nr:hypothetical protein [Kribbella italica]MBB5834559.1 hypothetical protein [Kribbella italica]
MSTDPSAYYAVVEITASEGPVGLVRQRPDGPGRCVDEILTRDGSWIPTDTLSRWFRGGELDQDLVLINAGEASELLAWFDDRTRTCPVIGGWTVGQAWWAQFSGDCAVDVLCAQLGLSVHGSLTNDVDRDLGFKVLSNSPDGRITMTLRRPRSGRWTVAVEYLRTEPSEAVVAKARTEARAAGAALGLTLESEQTHSSPSVSIDGPLVPPSARSVARLITLSYVGPLDDDHLAALRHTLHLDQEPTSGEDDEIELGERYLPNNGYHRTRMWLDRANATRWTFGLSTEGRRPPPDWIDHWRQVIDNAATTAGLRLDQEWRTPATTPEIPPQTVPTSLPRSGPHPARSSHHRP